MRELNYFWDKKAKISYILAVLVLLLHSSTPANYPDMPIWAANFFLFIQNVHTKIAVPLFFIISGALYYRDYDHSKYFDKIRRRFFSLIVPFLLWNIIN